MLKTVYKDDAINAVLSEPLEYSVFNLNNDSTCPVCAVGAVFRKSLGINNHDRILYILKDWGDFYTHPIGFIADELSIEVSLKYELYLHALSQFFESGNLINKLNLDIYHDVDYVRLQLANFIEAHFPYSFEVDV